MIKKPLYFTVISLLCFSGFQLSLAFFTDVEEDHMYADAIHYLYEQDYVQGYEDGSFKADQSINRAEFTKVIIEASLDLEQDNECEFSSEFTDVQSEDWFADYVCIAQSYELIQGYSDNSFKPENEINFVEAAKIISIAYGESAEESETWYESFVTFLESQHAVPESILNLDQSITRGEMAEMIYQLDHYTEGVKQTTPNVLLIILDDIGLDYFPGFLEDQDFEKASMPVMESLMDEAYRFTNLHTYSMCSPTRASLLTGHHGIDTGVLDPGSTSYLDPEWQSIQDELKELSDDEIATAVFGKWHLLGRQGTSEHPNLFGIDHYEGIISGNHESYYSWDKITNGVESTSETYATTDFTNAAIEWIDTQETSWFTWLAYTAPHTPIHLPPDDLHSYDELSGSENDLKKNKDQYFMAMLESVDTEIGRLLESMDEETRENTYVIVIGDNGTGGSLSQEPFKSIGSKGSMHVGGISTPMLVYSPYHSGDGMEHDELITTIDFFPSIVELFGYEASDELSGNSFASLIRSEEYKYDSHEFIFSQNLESVTVKTLDYKLIRHESDEEEFYDLRTDPFEENELLLIGLDEHDLDAYETVSYALDRYLEGAYSDEDLEQ